MLAAVAVAVAVGQVERAAFTVQTGVPAFSTLSYLEKPCHMCGLILDQPLPLLLLLLLINLLRKESCGGEVGSPRAFAVTLTLPTVSTLALTSSIFVGIAGYRR